MTDANELRNGPIASAIRHHRLVAILRKVQPQAALLSMVDELAQAGVRIFEITFDAASAADDVRTLRDSLEGRSDGPFYVGAGTLMRRAQLDAAMAAGAQFGVSPVLELELLRLALDAGLPFNVTGMTTTELNTAWNAGSTFVKLFPASAVGPNFVRDVRGPLPHVQILPSGGVDPSNARAFLDAGAVAVGVGSAIAKLSAEDRRAFVSSLAAGAETGR